MLNFLKNAVTPFHATEEMKKKLRASHFHELQETEKWDLKSGQKYFVTRNQSSIIAFKLATSKKHSLEGIRMMGAHTDSPGLKVRPLPELNRFNYSQLGVEIYGSPILSTWFDRDLSLAGRVVYQDLKNEIKSVLINFEEAIAVIPNLAIHLNREVNQNRSINPQIEIIPLLGQSLGTLHQLLKNKMNLKEMEKILSYELHFFDTQGPQFLGCNKEFLSSARLDNLLSCYVALHSLIESSNDFNQLIVCSDHEEVGSSSAQGAAGTFLRDVLTRIFPDNEERIQVLQKSVLISADNAHGVHPNYAEKHDVKHAPLINSGPVIKVNANQRYATSDLTQALIAALCNQEKIPYQYFVARSDMGCGSTIGPITATELGVATVDVGLPTFAMHSIRELAGVKDVEWLQKMATAFFNKEKLF